MRNLKKYRKGAITLEKSNFFKKLKKRFLDIYIRNVMPKFESSRLNGVVVIAKTYTNTKKVDGIMREKSVSSEHVWEKSLVEKLGFKNGLEREAFLQVYFNKYDKDK